LKRRQIANLARRRAIPGARLSANGYHYEYPVSRALRDWIMWKEFEIRRRKQCKLSEADKESPLMPESPEPNSRQTGIANLPGIRQMFDVWHKHATAVHPIEKWPIKRLFEVAIDISPIAVFATEIREILESRKPVIARTAGSKALLTE